MASFALAEFSRRAAAASTTVLLLGGGLSACAPHGPQASDGVILKVASQRGGTRALMESAGVLNGVPYRIEWSEFPSAQALLEALGAGAVDVGEVGDAPFMFAYSSGAKIRAAEAVRYEEVGSVTAIVVPQVSPVRSIADLKGRRIATGRGSIGHYLLLLALERAQLQPSDVNLVFLSPGDAKAAMSTGSVDAWSTWGSYVALAVHDDHARVIVDNRELLRGVVFEAATDAAIAGKHSQLDDFFRRLARAEQWGSEHVDVYARVLAKDTGLPKDIAQATLAARGRGEAVAIDDTVEAQERDTLSHFKTAGVIEGVPDVHEALDRSFNDAVGVEAPTKTPM
jgi:sulfonate transport system substrate-binding protein